MTVYLGELILIGILWFVSSFVTAKNIKKCFKFLAFGSILLMNCLRSFSIDPDTQQYLFYFNLLHNMSWSEALNFSSFEIGDVVLFKLIGSIWFNERFFVVVMSMITTVPVFIFINKKSKNIYCSLCLFMAFSFWVGSMYIMRQYTAMAFCLLSLVFIDKKARYSLPWFIICVAVACLFHKTAVFFIPVYLIKFIRFKFSSMAAFVIATAICVVWGGRIVGFMNTFARISYNIKFTGGLNLFLFTSGIGVLIPLLNKGIFKSKEFTFFYFVFLYAIVLQSLAQHMENMSRAASYVMISVMIVVPNFMDSYCKKKDNIKYTPIVNTLVYAVLVFMFVISFKNISISNYSIL